MNEFAPTISEIIIGSTILGYIIGVWVGFTARDLWQIAKLDMESKDV